jgi:hypothetical protein
MAMHTTHGWSGRPRWMKPIHLRHRAFAYTPVLAVASAIVMSVGPDDPDPNAKRTFGVAMTPSACVPRVINPPPTPAK